MLYREESMTKSFFNRIQNKWMELVEVGTDSKGSPIYGINEELFNKTMAMHGIKQKLYRDFLSVPIKPVSIKE
jgi:hypothetical protein